MFSIRRLSNQVGKAVGPIKKAVEEKLARQFPENGSNRFTVMDMSYMHQNRKGAESHFEILVVSDQFKSMSHLQRHKFMNSILSEESKQLHSISYQLHCPSKSGDGVDESRVPKCVNKKD